MAPREDSGGRQPEPPTVYGPWTTQILMAPRSTRRTVLPITSLMPGEPEVLATIAALAVKGYENHPVTFNADNGGKALTWLAGTEELAAHAADAAAARSLATAPQAQQRRLPKVLVVSPPRSPVMSTLWGLTGLAYTLLGWIIRPNAPV